MIKTISIAISLLTIMLGVSAHGDEKARETSKEFTKPITFRFLNEDGDPIQGDFTLHQYKNGKYFENWHRYLPLNEKGEITIKEFPPEFQFGGSSNDDFYHYWIPSTELDPTKDTFAHQCHPTGAMKFEITSFPKQHYDSLVVRYLRRSADGSHEQVKGIGIFPDDPEHTIGGLDPGTYYIEIKFDYEDKIPIFRSSEFEVKLKEYTSLPKIEITETAIEASDGSAETFEDRHKERDQQTREELYDRMAANSFMIHLSIQHSDLPGKDKETWIHQGAGVAFYYWMTTRKGGIRKSEKVDSAIALFYETAVESKMTVGFSDPLYRMKVDEPERIGVPGFSNITQPQYKEYVRDFQAFLDDALKARRMRQDERKKRREE